MSFLSTAFCTMRVHLHSRIFHKGRACVGNWDALDWKRKPCILWSYETCVFTRASAYLPNHWRKGRMTRKAWHALYRLKPQRSTHWVQRDFYCLLNRHGFVEDVHHSGLLTDESKVISSQFQHNSICSDYLLRVHTYLRRQSGVQS